MGHQSIYVGMLVVLYECVLRRLLTDTQDTGSTSLIMNKFLHGSHLSTGGDLRQGYP